MGAVLGRAGFSESREVTRSGFQSGKDLSSFNAIEVTTDPA